MFCKQHSAWRKKGKKRGSHLIKLALPFAHYLKYFLRANNNYIMQKSLYPSEIIDFTSEQIMSRHASKSNIIYCIVCLMVIVGLSLLPVLKISVSVQSAGIIRPVLEKNRIKLLVSGTVTDILIKDNQNVEKGQVILKLDTSVLEEKLVFNKYEETESKDFIHDLKILTRITLSNFFVKTSKLKTMQSASEYILLKNQVEENARKLEKAEKEAARFKLLRGENLISLSELEDKELEVARLQIEKNSIVEQQLGTWHKGLLEKRLKLKELHAQREQIKYNIDQCIIKSPVTGTLEQFRGFSIGSYLQRDQLVAAISPDRDLIAEVHISSGDIGLIQIGTKVNIQVDAFNYNQWGLVTGTVTEISHDSLESEDQFFFRVKCKLNQSYLQLQNGYKGYLKKGMTLRARFLITERTLFQLLFDNVDDWLNPLQKSEQ